MKKQLWLGVGLGILLFLATPLFANPIKETSDQISIQRTESAVASQPNGPYKDRTETSETEVNSRWNWTDPRSSAEFLAFTSTYSANTAASLMQNNGNSLSFGGFGRVPFYQLLMVTNDLNVNSLKTNTSRSATTLPEPTTLVLLGSGFAALAAGLRRKKRK